MNNAEKLRRIRNAIHKLKLRWDDKVEDVYAKTAATMDEFHQQADAERDLARHFHPKLERLYSIESSL